MSKSEKVNILLVDDRPENLLSIESIIKKDEYNLVEANSGEEALKYLLKEDVALILIDVQMPGMDCFSTAKMIKAREKMKDIPVLFIKANKVESEQIIMGNFVGVIDYIVKPVDPLILKSKVESFVNIYRMKQQVNRQKMLLEEKKSELERLNKALSETERKLKWSAALANVLNEASQDILLILDRTGTIIKANHSAARQLHYEERELIGENVQRLFIDEESRKAVKIALSEINETGSAAALENKKEVQVTKRDGTNFVAEVQFRSKFIQDTVMIACTIRDITERKKSEAIIKRMAYYDHLTGLPNRRAFQERLEMSVAEAKTANEPLSVMLLDLDGFKKINDSLGHHVGDLVLKEVGSRLDLCLEERYFTARVGGDEFNIILPNIDREQALEIADQLIENFQKPFHVNNYELHLTASIGMSILPYDGEQLDDLLKKADHALYQAKEQGKNKYSVFHTGMNMESYRSFMLQNDLRKAIDRDEFHLVYQPRVHGTTGNSASAEALLRWNHPKWGAVSPGEFIPLAERTGQIIEIGEWVLRTVCQQLKEWQEKGYHPPRVAINFSAKQFMQKDLVDTIEQVLMETDVPAYLLEIELTESALLGNEDFITNIIKQLRDLGISISIDDFGTGYSSLQYLSRLPVNILKVDRTFLQGVTEQGHANRSIVSAIISLAKSLNLSVIGEGVEEEEQLQFLKEQGCEEVQGYLFSPPVTTEVYEQMILQKTAYPFVIHKREDENREGIEQGTGIVSPEVMRYFEKEFSLSASQIELFELLLAGLTNKEISEKLLISDQAVKNNIFNILQKLNVSDRGQAMAKVYQYVVNKQIRFKKVL